MGATKSISKVVFFLLLTVTMAWAKVPDKVDVLIVGAGLSGLSTAYKLKQAGLSYHILEITPRIGGRVRTVKYERAGETLYADSGMEEYWESNPAVKFLKELALPLRHDVAVSSLVLQKQLVTYHDGEDPLAMEKRIFSPAEYNALRNFEKKYAPIIKGLTATSVVDPSMLKLKDISFADWVKKQGLPKRVTEWMRISLECEIGTSWAKISALDGLAEYHIFVGEGEQSYRVIGGNEKFTDALAKAVGSENISVNQRVSKISTPTGSEVQVAYLDQSTNIGGIVKARHVVSTVPLYRLFEVQFDPPLSAAKQQAIASQNYGAYFKAHVFVDAAKATKFWTKEGASILPVLSDSELGVIYDGNPDQKTKTKILSLLITGPIADAYNMMSFDLVRNQIKAGFERLWPGMSASIEGMEFYRIHPRAIAAWPVGRSRFDSLSQEIRRPENHVYLAGDFTESSHSDGAFRSAERVVEQILDEEVPARVPAKHHERKKVKDKKKLGAS